MIKHENEKTGDITYEAENSADSIELIVDHLTKLAYTITDLDKWKVKQEQLVTEYTSFLSIEIADGVLKTIDAFKETTDE